MRVLLLAKTEQLVMNPKLFGMHSLPVVGATANSGVPDRLFKHMGVGGLRLLRMICERLCAAKAFQTLLCVAEC